MTRDRKQASSVVCGAHLWDGGIKAGAVMMACEGGFSWISSHRDTYLIW